MKTKMLLLAVLASLFFVSCTKDEPLYSCDPDADSWAKANKAEIGRMNRVNFLAVTNPDYQRAAFRVFSLKQKVDLWKGKFDELLKMGWSEKERAHIEQLYTMLDQLSFVWREEQAAKSKSEVEQDDEQIELAAYRWITYATEELGWKDELIYAIAGTPKSLIDKNEPLQSISHPMKNTTTGSTTGTDDVKTKDCNCRDGHMGCSPGQCVKGLDNCTEVVPGCGLIGLQRCNGRCKL